MRTTLNFESKETKELLAKLDPLFFLEENIKAERYPQANIDEMYRSYHSSLIQLRAKWKNNRRQSNYLLEGYVRKMFTGGFIPALFHLDESRSHTIMRFADAGENLAYFRMWQRHYKRKVTSEKAWQLATKVGSVLAIFLSILKLYETFKPLN